MGNNALGQFEALVLMAVSRSRGHAYGMTIHSELEGATGRKIALGAVYTTLARLEVKGYIASEFREPTQERGGRARKYYALRSIGETALDEYLAALQSLQSRALMEPTS